MAKRPSWWLDFLRIYWPLNYLSARATGIPIIGRLLTLLLRPLFTGKNFNVSYIPVNRDIPGSGSSCIPEQVLEELIRRSSHRVTINRCSCRESEKCATYPVENACLHLGEDTRYIVPALATPRSVDEALDHMRGMIGRGLIPLVGRVRMDNFFYGIPNNGRSLTICFCCRCCCTILKSSRYFPAEIQASLVRLKGLRVSTDHKRCTACGLCVNECFMKAIRLSEGLILHDDSLCKGCGRCATVCPEHATIIEIENIDEAIGDLVGRIEERINIE